jgi:hypothetical protein
MRIVIFLLCIISSCSSSAASLFHSYITDLSPPYICKFKLKDAHGVSIDTKHDYGFSGICSIKLPTGNSWVYQNVWVDLVATWNAQTNEGYEVAKFNNDLGTVIVQLKCDDDPWLTKAQCAIIGYQNNTTFTNLSGVYNARTGQIPPFQTSTGQYPPLARNQAILREAIALSVWNARQEAAAAHTAFNQTFLNQQPGVTNQTSIIKNPVIKKRITRIFKKPKVNTIRLDVCLELNKNCGKPAADRFCQLMGYRRSVNCVIDSEPSTPTFIIGTQTICNQRFCKAFDEIECGN